MNNPLLQPFSGFDQVVPFDQIKTEHFIPALDEGIKIAKTKIEAIKNQTAPSTFENTFLALEDANDIVDRVANVYFNLFSAEANTEHQALAQLISPKLAAHSLDISLDPVIFHKIKEVYENIKALTPEQQQVVEKSYKDLVRNGAMLNETQKMQLRKIDEEASTLSPKFSENVLKATNGFELWITDKAELAGLPESAIEAAKVTAGQKGKPDQWVFTLQAPSFMPFVTYSTQRNLREKMWRAYNSRAFRGDFDNQATITRLLQLRAERAQLLGYKTHADYVLEERMARKPEAVIQFLNNLITPSQVAAQKDLLEVKEFRKSIDGSDEIKPWDFAFYSEQLREKKYSFNEEELRPYFKLENVVQGVFEHARKLYGLTFKAIHDVPVYHQDVQVFEVKDESTDKYVGLFYADFFPRETKKGGAWMTAFREQGITQGQLRRPHVSIVCNFTKPTPTKPSLLTYDEVRTLFHEFGHALHGLLSDCNYRTVSGTSVYWDFVELPSQIMENWAEEKEGLDLFAKHYETGESMPLHLIEKIKKSSKFQAGWMSLRQLSFSLMDMVYHMTDPSEISDVDAFETKSTSGTRLLEKIDGTNSSCAFSHIFAGGYSAGYYSYKWAEVLDADAFEFFKEKGIFNTEVAKKFKENILSRGGSEHPMELYKKFRGREPDPKALLRRTGLI